MSDPISGIASAAGDVASATINADAEQNTAKSEEQAAQQLAQQSFQEQTGYIGNQQQAYRDALTGVAQQGNPYAQVPADMTAPTYASGGTFGGSTFANGQATPSNGVAATNPTTAGLTGAQPSVAAGTAKQPQPVARVGAGVTNY